MMARKWRKSNKGTSQIRQIVIKFIENQITAVFGWGLRKMLIFCLGYLNCADWWNNKNNFEKKKFEDWKFGFDIW
jgi:hypothetical protein